MLHVLRIMVTEYIPLFFQSSKTENLVCLSKHPFLPSPGAGVARASLCDALEVGSQ